MKPGICIAGSGKLAVHIGLFFLKQQHPIHWLSHSSGQCVHIDQIIKKTKKRTEKYFPEQYTLFKATTSGYDANILKPDIIIESSRESVKVKQQIFASLNHLITDQTLLLSNSSSILPNTLHPHCFGAHFFFPLELTNIVELISCNGREHDRYQSSLHFLEETGLDVIQQDQHSAFLINRLLLPLQSLCFQALKAGFGPEEIEHASKSEMSTIGQLSLMDSIGLDIVMSAAINYQNLTPSLLDPDLNTLIQSLDRLMKMDKLGKKNKNGLLIGEPLPWPPGVKTEEERYTLSQQYRQLLLNGCHEAVQKNMLSKEHLRLVLNRIFHAQTIPKDFI